MSLRESKEKKKSERYNTIKCVTNFSKRLTKRFTTNKK